ncbi:hypothetical protein C8Q79DRAFT_973108 [Trametes meyenii]|nr:hypothetical protein C8Q79DRAFT_973108 [Trametes meyenii]
MGCVALWNSAYERATPSPVHAAARPHDVELRAADHRLDIVCPGCDTCGVRAIQCWGVESQAGAPMASWARVGPRRPILVWFVPVGGACDRRSHAFVGPPRRDAPNITGVTRVLARTSTSREGRTSNACVHAAARRRWRAAADALAQKAASGSWPSSDTCERPCQLRGPCVGRRLGGKCPSGLRARLSGVSGGKLRRTSRHSFWTLCGL